MKKYKILKDIFTTCAAIIISITSCYSLTLSTTTVEADEIMVPYLSYTFDNRLDGWQTTGAPRVGFETEKAFSGYCLRITNRLDDSYSMGMFVYDTFLYGYKYAFSVMFYQESEADQVFKLMGRTQNDIEVEIASGTVPNAQWTEIKGECVILESDPLNYLFISTENPTVDYYMDEMQIFRPENSAVIKEIDGGNAARQVPYEESVAQQQNKETTKETIKETPVSSIQIIKKEEETSGNGLTVALIAGCILAFVCIGLSVIILLSRKKKNTVSSSTVDPLTKFPNKTEYENAVLHYINNPGECSNLYVLICSVCFINYINDNYGTETGDQILTRCADCLRNSIGKNSKIYRSNGNEFMCFSESSMLDNVQKAIDEESKNDKGYPFACAVGEAAYNDTQTQNNNSDIRNTIMKADELMNKQMEKIINETHLGRHFPGQK